MASSDRNYQTHQIFIDTQRFVRIARKQSAVYRWHIAVCNLLVSYPLLECCLHMGRKIGKLIKLFSNLSIDFISLISNNCKKSVLLALTKFSWFMWLMFAFKIPEIILDSLTRIFMFRISNGKPG